MKLTKTTYLLSVYLFLPFFSFAETSAPVNTNTSPSVGTNTAATVTNAGAGSTIEAASEQKIKDFYLSNVKEDGSKDWELKGKEAVLRNEYVDINNMEAKYYSDKDTIFVKSEKAKLNKQNMDANLQDNVELKIPNKDGTYITVTCSGPLEMRYNDGIAIFNDNVVVDNPEGKLFADKATVYFDTKDKTKMKIVAEGHVKIMKDDSVAFAQKATYIGDSKNVVLEGSPRLVYFSQSNKKQ